MSIEKFHEWAGFYADRITGWMSVDDLKDGCGRLLTADAGSPELLLIHAMHQVTAQAAELEALRAERDELRTRLEAAERDRDIALGMLAAWCVAVDVNGTGWDDWDEYYKDAAYRPGPLRGLLDRAIAEEKAEWAAIDAAMQPKEQQAQKGEGV